MSEICKLFIEIYISRCYVLTVIYVLVLFGHWGSTDGKFCLCLLKIQNKIIQIIVFECVVEGQSVS
jgi:hypothetical protein